ISGAKRQGVEGNTAGIQSDHVLFSQRLDSRTFFVQDSRFGDPAEGGALFDGPDDEIIAAARGVMERLHVPAADIAETTILAEQMQEGRLDPDTGQIQVEPAYAGKRQALITRQIKELPVWSSSMLLGLNWDKSIGFLQLHWPEIPNEVLGRARKLQATVHQGWKPPDREGATVESVEAGVIHSPAIGFVMDF